MKNFLKLASGIDVMPLNLAIARRPELWKEDTYLRDYPQGPFGMIESIMLRFPIKSGSEAKAEFENPNSTYDQHESIDYPPYKTLHEARPIVMGLMHAVGGERLGRVMVNKIEPGGRIFPHVDTPIYTEYYNRFHVVLTSPPECWFRSGEEVVHMNVGEVWWFDNKQEHEVVNEGNTDRIHMVVDIRTSR